MMQQVVDFYRERFALMAGEDGTAYVIFVVVVGGVVFPMICMGLARTIGLFGKESRQ